jgi:hypothetical protein
LKGDPVKRKHLLLMSIAASLLLVSPVLAHHGTNLYDVTKAIILKATITKFEWGNPHNQIWFDVTDDKGNIVNWVVSTEPPAVMSERGWTRKSLKPGDQVTAYVYAAKNGAPVGNLYKLVLADGKVLTTAGPTAPSTSPDTLPADQKKY